MRKAILLPLLGLMVLAQWIVPWSTIIGNERILRQGEPLLFRTAPLDPYAYFRGEYVALRFAVETEDHFLRIDTTADFRNMEPEVVYALFGKKDNEATILSISETPPTGSGPFLRCIMSTWSRNDSLMGNIQLPFDRFYLEEGTGRATEDLIRSNTWEPGPELPAFALVRILNGNAVIEDLIIGDRRLREWVK